jgi:hypothetical protein
MKPNTRGKAFIEFCNNTVAALLRTHLSYLLTGILVPSKREKSCFFWTVSTNGSANAVLLF